MKKRSSVDTQAETESSQRESSLPPSRCRLAALATEIWQDMSHLNLVVWPCLPRIPHSSVVRASNRHLEDHGYDSRWKDSALTLVDELNIPFISFFFFALPDY